MSKKVLLFLGVLTAFIANSLCVFAEESITYPVGTQFISQMVNEVGDTAKSNGGFAELSSQTPLEEYLETECLKHSANIDISEYKVLAEDISGIYFSFATRHPELLIKTSLSWVPSLTGKYAKRIIPVYITESAAEDAIFRSMMNEKVQEYINLAAPFDDIVEKMLVIHDKMVENYKYDTEYSPLSYHAYGLFKNNKAVCQGYAQAFYMIMRELGVDCDFCISDSINHIWNYVKVNGKWFHVDVTWDDPVIKNSNGEIIERTTAYHDNFLVSDKNMQASHINEDSVCDWKTYLNKLPGCGSDFENSYLFNINSPFTIDYKDGYFNALCTVNGKKLVFVNRSLRAGDIAVSEPIESGSSAYLYYYGLSQPKSRLSVITAYKNEKGLSEFKVVSTGNIIKDNLYRVPIAKRSSEKYIDVLFWNFNELKPFHDKVKIN